MVQCHDNLFLVVDLRRANRHEFQSDGPGIVVRHALLGAEGDIVARLDAFVFGETERVMLDDFLGQGLRRWRGGSEGGEEGGGRGVGELGVENILVPGSRSRVAPCSLPERSS